MESNKGFFFVVHLGKGTTIKLKQETKDLKVIEGPPWYIYVEFPIGSMYGTFGLHLAASLLGIS